ncbi:HtaA domain-containing protein [Corynebacterium renale]|uniref:HtaA domain-containing protein n=1 Tax=Corynebacterium renale TaxID=1724 RepID=UPI0009FED69A|nr:HtaA domain-containing protein [Corynebacterium renale]
MNRLLVTALVPALAFGAVAPAGATEAGPYVTGEFSWLIKQSFIKHLKSPIAGGTFRGQGGAAVKDGTLVFPVNSAESHIDASGNGTINLDGSAHLTAYKGFARGGGYGLDLTYSDLKIQVQGTSATLIGDYTMAGASASDTSKELSVPATTSPSSPSTSRNRSRQARNSRPWTPSPRPAPVWKARCCATRTAQSSKAVRQACR